MAFVCHYREPAKSSSRDDAVPRLESRLEMMEQLLRSVISANVHNAQPSIPPNSTGEIPPMAINDRASVIEAHTAATMSQNQGVASPAIINDGVDGMGSITFTGEGFSGLLGPTSTSSFFKIIFEALKVAVADGSLRPGLTETTVVSSPQMISRPVSPPRSQGTRHFEPSQHMVDAFELPPRQETFSLMDIFFANTGRLFPYLYRPAILKSLTDMYQPGNRSPSAAQRCQINMILAFASVHSPWGLAPQEKLEQADIFFRRALAFMPPIRAKAASIESVQALLMVTQYAEGNQGSVQTWSFLGSAIQTAFELGLYNDAQPERISPLEKEIGNRAWWMCFTLDKMCSMTFGRPPMIPNTYMSAKLPLDIDIEALCDGDVTALPAIDPGNPSSASLFIHTSTLYLILGDIIEKVYRHNIAGSGALQLPELFENVIKIEGDLRQWRQQLPSNLSVVLGSNLASLSNSRQVHINRFRVILSLRYLNTHSLLHRAVVTRLLATSHSRSMMMADFLCNIGGMSINVGLGSAIDTIKMISHLAERPDMLPIWWFSIYYIFNAALILFGTIVVLLTYDIPLCHYPVTDLIANLRTAQEVLGSLGTGTRLVNRCQKVVAWLTRTGDLIIKDPCLLRDWDSMELPLQDMGSSDAMDQHISPFTLDSALGGSLFDENFRLFFDRGT
ncbi:fungal-specific transcription factor domain-containing protein [Aspergillus californicus]